MWIKGGAIHLGNQWQTEGVCSGDLDHYFSNFVWWHKNDTLHLKSHAIILDIAMHSSGKLAMDIEDDSVGRHSLFNFIYLLRTNATEWGYNEKEGQEKYIVEEKRESSSIKLGAVGQLRPCS